jgi:hypothetical protein
MRNFSWALVFIALSRAGVGITSVLNMWQLLRTVPDEFRGRVFSTNESVQWSVMMLSMMAAGIASEYWNPRTIGAIAGALSSLTAVYWAWANWRASRVAPAVLPPVVCQVVAHWAPSGHMRAAFTLVRTRFELREH